MANNNNNPPSLKLEVEPMESQDEEEANTQETFTQHEIMTQGNELTQLGMDDEDDDEDMTQTQSQDCNSPTPIDPLTLPWGRLMPVGLNNNDAAAEGAGGDAAAAGANLPPRPSSSRGALEMLPRPPTRVGSIGTRSRSPSLGGGGNSQGSPSPPCIQFLGLKNLVPSDRFNDYDLGRSAKVSSNSSYLTINLVISI